MSDIERILKEVIEEADNRLLEEETGEEEHTFSPEFERRIEELKERFFENGKYVGDKHAKPRRSLVIMRRIAACICCVILGAAMVVTVRAYGGEVVDWIVSVTQKDTKIRFEPLDGVVVPETIEREYVLSEIPEGYELVSKQNGKVVCTTAYQCKEDKLVFIQACYLSQSSILDTEDADVQETIINGNKAYVIKKNTAVSVLWENGEYYFILKSTAHLDFESLKNMASNIVEQ
ncbi:MAG: DUF4367 domain-containing protein [Clostridia bacterium]|nr:DUF4367 domain-containing protein [Clostridia bacterium]